MSEQPENLPQQTIVIEIEPWQQRRDPFLELCRELAAQRDKFTDGLDTDVDLSAAARSIHAVCQFLIVAVPTAPKLSETLHALGTSLVDLDKGRSPPLLKPRPKKPHGQSRPLSLEQKWAIAAATITLMMEEGMALQDAARCVAREFELRQRELPGRNGDSAAETGNAGDRLRNWRNRLLERLPTDPARMAYQDAIGNARGVAQSGESPAELLLLHLREMLAAPPISSEIAF